MAAPMWSKILPTYGHKMAATRWPAGEGSWGVGGPGLQGRADGELSSLQGKAIRGDQASRGGELEANQACRERQLGVTRPAGEGIWG